MTTHAALLLEIEQARNDYDHWCNEWRNERLLFGDDDIVATWRQARREALRRLLDAEVKLVARETTERLLLEDALFNAEVEAEAASRQATPVERGLSRGKYRRRKARPL